MHHGYSPSRLEEESNQSKEILDLPLFIKYPRLNPENVDTTDNFFGYLPLASEYNCVDLIASPDQSLSIATNAVIILIECIGQHTSSHLDTPRYDDISKFLRYFSRTLRQPGYAISLSRRWLIEKGLQVAEANRPAAAGQVARPGQSGLAVRLQLRRAQPHTAAATDGSTTGNAPGAVCLNRVCGPRG